MTVLRRIGKILLYILLSLLLLSLLLIVVIQIPAVQTWAAEKAAKTLSKTFGTEVSVGGVDIDFFKTAVLEDIFVADQHGDTLLFAHRLAADIGVFNLFGSEIYLNKAELEGAVVYLHRNVQDSVFNYQFIVDQFAPTSTDTTASAPWTFGIGKLSLENVRFDMRDEGAGRFDLRTAISEWTVTADELDFEKQKIALGEISINSSEVVFRQLVRDTTTLQPATDTLPLTFPGIGWTLTTEKIRLENNHIAYLDDNAPRLENALDFSHLDLQNLNLSIDDFQYADNGILAEINDAGFTDAGGFRLEKLEGRVAVLPNQITVENFVLQTPNSNFQNDTKLVFKEFNDLTDFVNKVKLESDFEESRLAVSDLLMLVPALRTVQNVQFPEGEVLRMKGKFGLQNDSLSMDGFSFFVSQETRLQASGSIAQLTKDPRYNLQITELTTSYGSLKKHLRNIELPKGLSNFGRFRLQGRVVGTLGNLAATGLKLTTQSDTRFSGDIRAKGLPDMEKTVFDLKIEDLATRAKDLKGFSEKPLPPQLDSLGLVQFAGNYKGMLRDLHLDGKFTTGAGGAETDLAIKFNKDYTFATYSGRLAMLGFDLGKVLGDTSQVGKVSLTTQLDGSGLTLDDINTTLDGEVQSAVFQGYEYKKLQVDGRLVKRLFEGKLSMDDPNLRFDLAGKLDLNDTIPDVDAIVNIDTVNFKNLKLTPQPLALSGKVEAKLRGNHIDNLIGQASLTGFAISNDDRKYYDPKISIEAKQLPGGGSSLLFDAAFMKARLEGRYKVGDLNDLIIGYINDFFPVDELSLPEDGELLPRSEMASQKFDFDFQFTDLPAIVNVFLPGSLSMDTSAYLKGTFDSGGKLLDVTGIFPALDYQGAVLDSLTLLIKGDGKTINSSIAVRNLDYNGTFYAPFLNIGADMGNDSMHFDVVVLSDTLKKNFQWGGSASQIGGMYTVLFDELFVLDGDEWQVAANNQVLYGRKKLTVRDLIFKKGEQTIAINSVGAAPPGDYAPLELRFGNFRLSEFSALLNNPDMRFSGMMNGDFTVKQPLTNLHYNAGVQVDSLAINDQLLGQLDVKAEQPAGLRSIEIMTKLSGENEAEVRGVYAIPDKKFNVKADFTKLGMVVTDLFLNAFIRDSKGYLSGGFTLTGTPDKPALNGSITTHDLSTEVVLSGARYRTDGSTIRFSDQEIDLGNLELFDANGRRASLSGKIKHSYFNDIQLDMRAQTDGFQILDTDRKANPLYYGQLFASADVRITGTADAPKLYVIATTQDSTLLHVEPLTSQLAVVQEDYIIFSNPANYKGDSLNILERQLGKGRGGFDLELTLQVTSDARLNIIIDPLTGDQLFCSGTGNFNLKMNRAGDISITGTYVIDEGSYTFNYEGLVKRDFEIRKGSSLSFYGDPYDARFNITAVYKTRATTYELISNEATLDDATLSASQRRSDVEVLMSIEGSLNEPEITFDILLPESQGGVVDNISARKLAALRDDPTELNKQVFGLLFFNSFIQSETGAGLAGVGENTALKSVSGLITSQLNRLAGRFIKGVDLTIGFESYRAAGQDAGTVTEFQVGLSKQLFNNRLTVKLGSNIDLENSQQSAVQEGGYSAIASDFVLEYKLNERGNYLLKVFHKSDYNILLDANTTKTGVGILYRRSY